MAPSQERARLLADIRDLCQKDIPHVKNIRQGDTEGEVVFTFMHDMIPSGEIEVTIMLQNPESYPRKVNYIVFAISEAPENIRRIFEDLTSINGMAIADMLDTIRHRICASFSPSESQETQNQEAEASDACHTSSSDWEDDDIDMPYESDEDDGFGLGLGLGVPETVGHKMSRLVLERIRQDFRTCKDAGFRVGKISGANESSNHGLFSISIKAGKLGISDAMRIAWNLSGPCYVVLLMKCEGGYTMAEDILEANMSRQPRVQFRLLKCARYRPTPEQAWAAFSSNKAETGSDHTFTDSELPAFGADGFISLLLNKEFPAMMKIRKQHGVSWNQARKMRLAFSVGTSSDTPPPESISTESSPPDAGTGLETGLPPILKHDHLLSEGQLSLPLVAAQFAFYYLVKSRDYCMVCQEKVDKNFEAFKPYVCSKPLCLFQYMNLGLGPSIDHEIISQDRVVDLLISLCYASIWTASNAPSRLPIGMNLQVPCIRSPQWNKTDRDYTVPGVATLIDPISVQVTWGEKTATVTSNPPGQFSDLKTGQWVVIHASRTISGMEVDVFHYARIENRVGGILELHVAARHAMTPSFLKYAVIDSRAWHDDPAITGRLVRWDQSLDDLETDHEKAFSMILLLCTLPSVKEMKAYLEECKSRTLPTWDRIAPAAMKLLRWIIASNRSVILQLDNDSEERIPGFPGWAQFRFAQSSPEKEVLFKEALQAVKKPQRTLLAWHGSAARNWHSIIREGLNFDYVAHGRAFGDGVYFSRSFDYSRNYSQLRSMGLAFGNVLNYWPKASFNISKVVSLNELVNLPEQFVHSQSFYVVSTLHWIQCRYLFVQVDNPTGDTPVDDSHDKHDHSHIQMFKQDPAHRITGLDNNPVCVPMKAIPSAIDEQGPDPQSPSNGQIHKYDTDEEDEEDLKFLEQPFPAQTHADSAESDKTDFRPGALDHSRLPRLAAPANATQLAQKAIQKQIKMLKEAQDTTPLHELGWYIDFGKIENMFQWIVELHSFDPALPLAQDMKAAGITSIVIEIQFLSGYPMVPPFVRVIEPRFLPFVHGGGGHVTGGGAMCMELLTSSGWTPVMSMESVLFQVRMAMCNLEPRPARLQRDSHAGQYSVSEAVAAYERAATAHGWSIPAAVREIVR